MPRFHGILFPIDFSERSRAAAPFVLSMAQRYGAPVVALHVLQPPPPIYGGMNTVYPDAYDLTGVAEDLRCELVKFAAAELPKVTQVFVQGDNAVAREKGGAGLGLPLAKQLIELHGGRMQLDSEPNKGTTVTLRLPPGRLISGGLPSAEPAMIEYVGD